MDLNRGKSIAGGALRLLLQHRTSYRYPRPAALGPHIIRLRPAGHTKAKVESYGLSIGQPCQVRWQQDPVGNHLARVTFPAGAKVPSFDVCVELAIEVNPVNPFDFFVDDAAKEAPVRYPEALARELAPFMASEGALLATGPLFARLHEELPRRGASVPLLVELNRQISQRVRYVIRDEPGIWTPEETLANGRGSCRDSAVLLGAILRARGFAARFVSGYLVQLTDEGMIPDEPKGVGRDVVDLHAWTEVYLPGAGWLGLDSTSGLLCGEGHIPLCCAANPALASPVEGTSSEAAESVSFEMTVARLGHEPRPTAPYVEETWQRLLEVGQASDEKLASLGLELTMGGEPTFTSREHLQAPEWNGEALGPTKRRQGLTLAAELRKRLSPGAAIVDRPGKHYPGESLPRWALEIVGRSDGVPLWPSDPFPAPSGAGPGEAKRLAEALAQRLGAPPPQPAFEDPWRFLQDEASLPIDVNPLRVSLKDPRSGAGSRASWTEAWAWRRAMSCRWRARTAPGAPRSGASAAATSSSSPATALSACGCRCALCRPPLSRRPAAQRTRPAFRPTRAARCPARARPSAPRRRRRPGRRPASAPPSAWSRATGSSTSFSRRCARRRTSSSSWAPCARPRRQRRSRWRWRATRRRLLRSCAVSR